MSAYAWGMPAAIVLLSAARLVVFYLALRAHRRWHIPVADLERLVRACYPRRTKDSTPPQDSPPTNDHGTGAP